MGHRNTQFSSHLLNSEEDGQGHSGQQPEPAIFYGNVSSIHHPNIRSSIPPHNNFSFPRMPEHRDIAFFHNVVQYRGFPPQATHADLDLAMAQPSTQYNPYSTSGDSSVQVHGANEQLSLSNTHYGGPAENFPLITSLLDNDPRKRKSLEMALPVFPFHNISGGPSSSANPSTSGQVEFNDSQIAPFSVPYERYVNGPSPLVEAEHSRSIMTRPDVMGQEAVIPYSGADPMIQGNIGPSPVPYQSNPWSDMQFGASNGDAGSYLWPPTPSFPYMTANPNGARVEAGNIGLQQGYQLSPSGRSSYGFMHPTFAQVSPYLHMQGSMGYGITYPLQPGASAQSIPTGNSWNSGIGPYQSNVDTRPLFVPPPIAPAPAGFQLFGYGRGEPVHSANARYRQFPMRYLREDEAAVPDATSSHETGSSDDQHNDMRMDIDDMSYEELLALEEEIGQVATGLTEDFIQRNLRSRTITLSEIGIDLEDIPSPDHQIHLCTVCQDEYEGGDTIGSLDCGHEYHTACIKQWLVLRNTCPVCKATALSSNNNTV